MELEFEPYIVKGFLSQSMVERIKTNIHELKKTGLMSQDPTCPRLFFNDLKLLGEIQHAVIYPYVVKKVNQYLKPSYNFTSMYEGRNCELPLHLDRDECLLTIDVCIEQSEEWPIYINTQDTFETNLYLKFDHLSVQELSKLKANRTKYILNPGDALFFNGTRNVHWREKIERESYCSMVLFHFDKGSK